MPVIARSHVIQEARVQTIFEKAGAFVANDFAGSCAVGSLGVDTTTPKLYQCTATNGSTTSTWAVVGAQT